MAVAKNATVLEEPAAQLRWRGEMRRGILSTKSNTLIRGRYGAEMTVTPETIRIRAERVSWDFTIPRESVTRIERGGLFPWFWMGIRVRHSDPNVPQRLQFVARSAASRDIIRACGELGYPTV